MKKAIYLRKSRGVIDDLEKHKRQLLKICKENKWEYDLYEEIASSEKLEEREQLSSLLNKIDDYDGVVCIHMDRLSRNELHQALITQILREHNVKVITLNKVYDFNKENDILLGDFEKLIARQELRLTKARLKRGKISAFEKGYWVNGRPPMPYVYDKVDKMLYIDKEKLKIFKRIKTMALKGESCNFIGERIGVNPTMIRRLLKSKVHLGYTKYKGEYIKGLHKAVITRKEYEKINNILEKKSNGKRKTKHHYFFTDLIRCSCGHKRTAVKFGDKDGVLKCKYCNDSGAIIENFREKIQENIENYTVEIEVLLKGKKLKISDIEKEKRYIEEDIKKENQKINNTKKMMINGILTFEEGEEIIKDINKKIQGFKSQKENIEEDIKNLNQKTKIENLEIIEKTLKYNVKESEVNNLYKTIINYITIKDKKIERISWR